MKRRRFSLDVRPGAVALLAGLYFLLPLRWCARLALAVAVHELGHVAALVLCGAEIYGLRMEACGLALRCAPPEGAVRTIAAALAGPAAGAGLFCILRGLGYPEGADLSLLYACANLLPVLPLDGGQVVGAVWEGIKRTWARVTGRPDPGYVDVAKGLPIAYAVSVLLIGMTLMLAVADLVKPISLG